MANFPTPPTFAPPIEEDRITKRPVFSPMWLQWFLDVARIFSDTGLAGGSLQHNMTEGLQGGTTDEYYHLDSTDYAALSEARTTKGVVAGDDLIVDSGMHGLVIRDNQSPPHYWRLRISDTGAVTTTDLGTALP